MELKKVSDEDYEYLHYQYNKAFPVDERAPFRRVWKKALEGKADFCYAMMGTGGEVKPEEYQAMMRWHAGRIMSRILGLRMEKGGDRK